MRAVRRALGILEVFGTTDAAYRAGEPECTLEEIAFGADLPKSTAHRLLETLLSCGFIERGKRPGTYRLGAQVGILGSVALRTHCSSFDQTAVQEILERLRDELDETVGLSVRLRDRAVLVARMPAARPLRFDAHVGWSWPLHCTSSGKVLLAYSRAALENFAVSTPSLQSFTPATTRTLDELHRHLDTVRECGYAVDNEEFLDGLRCLAVPVRDQSSTVNYALAISGPASRLHDDVLVGFVGPLKRAADELRPYVAVQMI